MRVWKRWPWGTILKVKFNWIWVRWCHCNVGKEVRITNNNWIETSRYLYSALSTTRHSVVLTCNILHYNYINKENKYLRESNAVGDEHGTEVFKMSKIFGPRWAAYGAWTIKVVWKLCLPLYSRSNNGHTAGLVSYFKTENFLKDLV